MGKRAVLLLTVVAAMLLAFSGVVLAQSTTPDNQQATQPSSERPTPPLTGTPARVCPAPPGLETARCHAIRLDHAKKTTDSTGGPGTADPSATTGPTGYSPSDLQAAYNVPSGTAGSGKTVAIVDAYDNPNALQDLKVYRDQFQLDESHKNATGPKITKMNQNGNVVETFDTATGNVNKNPDPAVKAPAPDVGWGQEIALDLDMASAICPECNILLVEANSNSLANLGTAVNIAARYDTVAGNVVASGTTNPNPVAAISNSYGSREFLGEASYESYFKHPGIAVTVSSGDSGYGAQFPAASQYVTAVGGTSLTTDGSSRGWSEKAWSGAGSGCSAYIAKPTWQTNSGCSKRTVADVAAVADPYTGVSVYDSYGSTSSDANWLVFGGTSASAPIIAAVYGLAGNAATVTAPDPGTGKNGYGSYPYFHTSYTSTPTTMFDVTSGSNGNCKKTIKYLCTSGTDYDGPTGLGTPNGTGAF